jgi:hypothetical protein
MQRVRVNNATPRAMIVVVMSRLSLGRAFRVCPSPNQSRLPWPPLHPQPCSTLADSHTWRRTTTHRISPFAFHVLNTLSPGRLYLSSFLPSDAHKSLLPLARPLNSTSPHPRSSFSSEPSITPDSAISPCAETSTIARSQSGEHTRTQHGKSARLGTVWRLQHHVGLPALYTLHYLCCFCAHAAGLLDDYG